MTDPGITRQELRNILVSLQTEIDAAESDLVTKRAALIAAQQDVLNAEERLAGLNETKRGVRESLRKLFNE